VSVPVCLSVCFRCTAETKQTLIRLIRLEKTPDILTKHSSRFLNYNVGMSRPDRDLVIVRVVGSLEESLLKVKMGYKVVFFIGVT